MKNFVYIALLLCSIQSYGQVYIKGSGIIVPFIIDGNLFSGSIASEVRYKHLGAEYMNNYIHFDGDVSSYGKTKQLMLKGYMSFLNLKRLKNLYLGVFAREINKIYYDDIYSPDRPNPMYSITKELGVMLGRNFDFTKHFGMEAGIYYYKGRWELDSKRYDVVYSSPYLQPKITEGFGIRIYLYLKVFNKLGQSKLVEQQK